MLGACVVLARLLMPEHKALISSIRFRHEAPADARLLRKYLAIFQCPVYFGEAQSSVVMPAEVLM